MKRGFLIGLIYVGISIISGVSYGQELGLEATGTVEKVTKKEEKQLEFQNYFFEALKQKAINNYKKAIENLEMCNSIEANNTAVEFEFAKNYLALKNYYEAEIFIDKALKKEPENVYLLQFKVLIFKSQRNFSEAIKVQKKLIELNSKYTEDLILLYLQNQEFDNAEKLIVEVEKNALASMKIKGYKHYLERKMAVLDTLDVSNTVANSAPNTTTDIVVLKKQYNASKDYAVLVKILNHELENELFDQLFNDSKNGLEYYPSQPYLYKMNALALNKLAKYNEAISVLTIGIDFVIENNALEAEFYEQFAISYNGLNNKNEALKYKQKAEQLRLKD
jgi:tetratricopeptide (TPR) repeat protein